MSAPRGSQFDLFSAPTAPPAAAPAAKDVAVPYRTTPRQASDDEVRAANRAAGLKGARRYKPAMRAEGMARSAQTMVDDRLRSFLHHPDELVPVGLIHNRVHPKPWDKYPSRRAYVSDALYQRALGSAEREGVFWTPLIDALAESSLWPTTDFAHATDPELGERVPHRTPLEQAARLADWIAAQTRPELLSPLTRFRHPAVWRTLASSARVFDDELLTRILDDGRAAPQVAANPHLTPEQIERVRTWAMDALTSQERESRSDTRYRTAGTTLVELEQSGRPPSRRDLDLLVEAVKSIESDMPRWRRVANDYYAGTRRGAALRAVCQMENVPADLLMRLYERVKDDSTSVMEIVKHASATIEVWRHVASDSSLFQVRDYLSSVDEARRDPEIRRILARSTSPDVLIDLARDSDPKRAARHIRKMAKNARATLKAFADPEVPVEALTRDVARRFLAAAAADEAVVGLLRLYARDGTSQDVRQLAAEELPARFRSLQQADEAGARRALAAWPNLLGQLLTPADLTPFLRSKDKASRLAAIQAMGHIQKNGPESSSPPSRSR